MNTLYRTVRIESAEQAEALPVGTVAFNPQDLTEASVRVQNGWHITGQGDYDGSPYLFKHSEMVGDVVLVPLDATAHQCPPAEPAAPEAPLFRFTGRGGYYRRGRSGTDWDSGKRLVVIAETPAAAEARTRDLLGEAPAGREVAFMWEAIEQETP